jgi:hypothetical protein
MDAIRFSETSLNFYQITRQHTPEDVLFIVTAVRTLNLGADGNEKCTVYTLLFGTLKKVGRLTDGRTYRRLTLNWILEEQYEDMNWI